MVELVTRVWAVRARMVDGAICDLLLFFNKEDAEKQALYVQGACGLLGYDRIDVVPRRVIGKEPLERRNKLREGASNAEKH